MTLLRKLCNYAIGNFSAGCRVNFALLARYPAAKKVSIYKFCNA